MDDAEGMSGAECVRCFHQDAPGFFRWQSLAALETRRERFTVHIGHHEVHESLGTFTDGMNRDDVRVGQAGGRFLLPEETHAEFPTGPELRRGHFYWPRPPDPLLA